MAGDEREGEEESRGENRGRRGERREHGRGTVWSYRWAMGSGSADGMGDGGLAQGWLGRTMKGREMEME